jgi:hypothetical protein
MRTLLLTLVVAMLPTWAAAAEEAAQQQRKPTATQRPANPCAVYGAGFVPIEGTSTCVKMGGSTTVEVGGKSR